MILPTKHVSLNKSLLGAGAVVLPLLAEPITTTGIWEQVKNAPEIGGYGRFVLTLDFLYAVGAVDMVDGLIARKTNP